MKQKSIKNIRKEFKENGIFYTPPELAKKLLEYVDIKPKSVYDPTCGAGNLLKAFPDEVKKYGQEIDEEQIKLIDIPNFTGYAGDVLVDDGFKGKEFDCIVANPPFSVRWDPELLADDERFSSCSTLPPPSKADWAFMLHILSHLSRDGVGVVLEFPGILYRGQREGKVREWFIENNYIDRVVNIPGNTFEDTAICTCIVVLKKNKRTTKREILKMTELQTALNGGVQIVPEWTEQVVFLDFGGAQTSYNGEILTLDDVNVENSGLTASRIAEITVRLNAEYAKRGIRFVTTEPISGEYSTIYIGKTSAFDSYGSFNGLAETIDSGNKNRTDKAFVNLDSFSSDDAIVNIIEHELGHITGTLDHGGEGLDAYGCKYKYITLSGTTITKTSKTSTVDGISRGWTKLEGYPHDPSCVATCSNIIEAHKSGVDLIITNAGALLVDTSATTSNTIIKAAGLEYLHGSIGSGGRSYNTVVENGGTQGINRGSAFNTIVKNGGVQKVYNGIANDTIIESGGSQLLELIPK